jgi:hypothetical protein
MESDVTGLSNGKTVESRALMSHTVHAQCHARQTIISFSSVLLSVTKFFFLMSFVTPKLSASEPILCHCNHSSYSGNARLLITICCESVMQVPLQNNINGYIGKQFDRICRRQI